MVVIEKPLSAIPTVLMRLRKSHRPEYILLIVFIYVLVIMDAVNLMVHVLNSIIMLIDLMIVGHPIKMTHAYWTMGIGLVYAIFSVVYFIAGGTTRYVHSA